MIEKIKFNLIRRHYTKNLTDKIGKLEIKDDKIICYVKKSAICKERNEFFYNINLRGTTFYGEELKNKYNLNKPIYYIFDNITFNRKLYLLSGVNTHIIFRNCTFNDAIEIIWGAEEITFENNTYYNKKTYFFDKKLYFGCKTKKLNFINDVFMNMNNKNINEQIYFGISARVEELNILNSDICISDSKGKIMVDAKHTKIKDSIIRCPNIEIKSDIIEMKNSRITAYDEIIIDNKMNNELDNIDAKEILYNGILIQSDEDKDLIIDNETISLSNKRLELINVLESIKVLVKNNEAKKLKQIQDNLESQSINKILKLK